ncbi:MFS transporter [Frigidibacter sp. MR17.14]|uniref:MFS transporter n=1 Tax=Frigidibacter sp. MR17.14 TaxID=3126509 RepID=UPI003012C7BC
MTASTVLALARGLGLSLISANIPQLQGSFGATSTEATWLVAAYMAPQASLTILLVKLRTQVGLRRFAEVSIVVFALVCLLSFIATDLRSGMLVRFFWGVAAAPISTLAFFYMLEAFPPAQKMTVALPLAITNLSIATPVARLISPELMDNGGWTHIAALELGLALIGLGFVYRLPLTPIPRAKVIHWRDLLSYALLATGLGAATVALTMGRLYWWFDAPWIGWTFALSAVTLTAAVALELNRATPLIDIRWLASPAIVHFAGALLVFRIVLAEQSSGAPGMFQALGLLNEQTRLLYLVILAATFAGGFTCATVMKAGREPAIHAVALVLLVIGALMDSQVTSQTRPNDMLLSQALIAMATGLFLPPAMSAGLGSALAKGPVYILSFIAVFLSTQIVGAMAGSAIFSTFIQNRIAFHARVLYETLPATDPLVTARVAQYAGAYAQVLPSAGARQSVGLSSLNSVVTREATVLAYGDAFFTIALIAAAALAALLVHITILAILARRSAAAGAATAS